MCLQSVVLSCVFFCFSIAVFRVWLLALLGLVLTAWFGLWAYRLFFQPEKVYIEIGEGSLTYTEPFKRKVQTVLLKDIKHLQHLKHHLRLIMGDSDIKLISLNYLSEEDIKKLMLFIKYAPQITNKVL